MTFSLFIKAPCCHPILILENEESDSMGQSLKATTNSMKQSEPQAIAALRESLEGEGCVFRETQL
jgi:hypothetical protein